MIFGRPLLYHGGLNSDERQKAAIFFPWKSVFDKIPLASWWFLFHDFKSSRLWMTSPRIQSVEFWSLLWRLGTGWNNKQNTVQISWKPPWQAGGVGLNLTTANHVIHFDRCWNPAKEAQAGGPQFSVVVLMLNAWQNFAEKDPQLWKLAVSEATDRAHRIGQHRTVLLAASLLKHCGFNCFINFRHSDPRVIQMMWN